MTILETLGALPTGETARLSWDDVTQYLRKHYVKSATEAERRLRARNRRLLYKDSGDLLVDEYIDKVFDDPTVKNLRHRFTETSKYNNVSKRIVNELATTYARPPTRTVAGDENDAAYQAIIKGTAQDQLMRRLNRYMILHRQALLGFRVSSVTGRPTIDIVTPDSFWAVHHPLSLTEPIAYIFDRESVSVRSDADDPRYLVWTNHERFSLTEGGLLTGEVIEHGLGRMPWVLASIEPADGCLLDDSEGADITAAHLSVWFQNVMLLKESKSANRQTAFSGDTTTTASGQSADSDVDLILGDGVAVSNIDRGVDLAQYRDTADHILERVAANYGIPPSVLKHEGATSGYEIELRRIGIRERRIEQEPVFRSIEREFAEVQAMVLAADLPGEAFTADGWSINFGETQTPQDPGARLDVFERERRMGLSNTLAIIMERDPDLSVEQAIAVLMDNIEIETMRNEAMRPLLAISGSMGNPPSTQEPADDEEDDDEAS
jgi:hypothetical protein